MVADRERFQSMFVKEKERLEKKLKRLKESLSEAEKDLASIKDLLASNPAAR